ncbi:MAG: XdhC/CoxI family protein [Bacteroidetes bacterium]|nr:MAG: XdhC/CoxI family protein [Bacteroidota bacterium]
MSTSIREIKRMLEAAHHLPEGSKAVLATVVRIQGSSYRRTGARLLVTEKGQMVGGISGGCLEGDAMRKALRVMDEGRPRIYRWDTTDPDGRVIGAGLGCRGIIDVLMVPMTRGQLEAALAPLQVRLDSRRPVWIAHPLAADSAEVSMPLWWIEGEKPRPEFAERPEIEALQDLASAKKGSFEARLATDEWFVEYLPPALRLVIVGGGYDVPPVLELAAVLGWQTAVVANLQSASAQRLALAGELIHLRQKDVWAHVAVDPWTAVVLMSHDYALDLEALRALAPSPAPYIGVLGPHKRHERMAGELPADWLSPNGLLHERRYAPIGLDIGAQTPEEIALSIVAEIRAVFAGRQGGHLRQRQGGIYDYEAGE